MKAVNLIPTDVRRAGPGVQSGGLGPGFAVIGLLGIALLLVTIYVLSSNTIAQRKVKLAALQTEVSQEQAVANQLAPYASYTKLAQSREAAVAQIAQSRFDWHVALAELSRVVPADASLTSLLATTAPGSGGGIGSGGGNTSTLRSDINAPAFQISGCTSSADDVARLMSRLRLINGVQRVTLSDSVKSSSGGSSAASTPSSSGGGACTSKQTDFDLVVFFMPIAGAGAGPGGSAPGAGLPAGSAAPTASAQQAASSSSTSTAAPGAKS